MTSTATIRFLISDMGLINILGYIGVSATSVFSTIMLVRAICSWIPTARESMVYRFSYTITEPIIAPVRKALMKIERLRTFPIDISFLVVYISVDILASIFASLIYM